MQRFTRSQIIKYLPEMWSVAGPVVIVAGVLVLPDGQTVTLTHRALEALNIPATV